MAQTRPLPGLSRRTLLGAGVVGGGVLLIGCSTGSAPSGRPSTAAGDRSAPDVEIATSALAAVRAAHLAVSTTRRRFPELRRPLAPLLTMHETHQETLTDAVPEPSRHSAEAEPYVVPKRRPAAAAKLRKAEKHLQAQLNSLARRASSGEFARLLAAMGAGLAQQLHDWPA